MIKRHGISVKLMLTVGKKHLWVFVSQTPKPWGDKGKRHIQKNILMYK